jgi:hypothetical protein
MKNKKSPLKFVGAIGPAMAAMGTQQMLGRLGGIFGSGGSNMTRHTGVGGLGEDYAGQGSRVITAPDVSTQFNPAAVGAMEGIFGNVSGRQASLGASGLYALEKHLSPVKNDTEMSDSEKKLMHATQSVNDKYAVDLGTVKTKKSNLTAYKPPNPPFDPTSGDDGAGGTEYDTN